MDKGTLKLVFYLFGKERLFDLKILKCLKV